jgi:hypothetical protein
VDGAAPCWAVSGKNVKAERANERTRLVFIREFLLEMNSCGYLDDAVHHSVFRLRL